MLKSNLGFVFSKKNYRYTYRDFESAWKKNDDDDDGVIINIANHSTCWRQHAFARYSFVSWDSVERVHTQEAITAKKSLWSPSSSSFSLSLALFLCLFLSVLSLSLSSPSFYAQRDYYLIILNTCELLSIKYQVLPLESSSSTCSRTDKRTSTIRNCSFSFSFCLK